MSIQDSLYAELWPDIEAVAGTLFEFSKEFIKNQGGHFLPHGAILTTQGEVRMVAAAPDSGRDLTNSIEVLPVLYDGLRRLSRDAPAKAVGVAEDVTVTQEGKQPTQAIKVLFEHRRGLTVALYLPFEKKLLRGYVFGKVFAKWAEPEVHAWSRGNPLPQSGDGSGGAN